MQNDDKIDTVRAHYNADPQGEWDRLTHNPYEFDITAAYLNRYVGGGTRLLDIGGGPGRYSIYYAEKGAEVTLFDLSEVNVAFAMEKAAEAGVKINGVSGDARFADKILARNAAFRDKPTDGYFDVVLLMGPMYHLLDEDDRKLAVTAALRLLKPGGILAVSYISVSGGMIYLLRECPEIINVTNEREFMDLIVEDKAFAGAAFTMARFERAADIVPYFDAFGLEKLHFLGAEGVLAPFREKVCALDAKNYKLWLDYAIKLCEREEYLAFSEHLLYIGRKAK